jgi:predicted ester cyclase
LRLNASGIEMTERTGALVREHNVSMVRRFITLVMERGLVDFCDDLLHREVSFVDPSMPTNVPVDGKGIRLAVRAVHEHFDGYTLRLDDIFPIGTDTVVNRFTGHATHKGGFLGSKLVNKPITWTGNTIYRFKDNRIFRVWLQWDLLGTMIQLGILPAPAPNTPPPWMVPPTPGTPFVAADRRTGGAAMRDDGGSVESNIAKVRRLFDGIASEPIPSLIENCLSLQYRRDDNCALGIPVSDLDAFAQYARAARECFNGYHMNVQEIFGEGDKVVARVHVTGVHRGGFLGVAQGGQKVDFTLTAIYGMHLGKIAHAWVTWDVFRALNQLGAIPAAPQTLSGPIDGA